MTSSERLSPEPLLKKEASPAVLRGLEFWKCSGGFKSLEFQGLGVPSCGVFSDFFPEFLLESPSCIGGMAQKVGLGKRGLFEKGSFQKSPFSRDS